MSEWAKLNIAEKVARAPVKRDVGSAPSSEPGLSEWIRNARVADMEYREELGEYAQLVSIKANPGAWQILRRLHPR
jgi:hypothetical protein